jgi:hypothetical protein
MMEEIFAARSTNGRWGLAVVGPEGAKFPAQGSLRHVGKVAGLATYEFVPGETGTWVLPVLEEVTVHGGATLVAAHDLQSGGYVSLLLLGPQAVVERYGYKRRSSRVVAYVAGAETHIPGTVLAAMGLLQADGEVVAVAPPPVLGGAMAAAFAALKGRN